VVIANEVVADVIHDPSLFGPVFQGMLNDDPLIRMRSAGAVEKITVKIVTEVQMTKL
jgi:hypothetical protein